MSIFGTPLLPQRPSLAAGGNRDNTQCFDLERMKLLSLAALLLCPLPASAQLAVTVSPGKVTGQKAIVPLTMENNFAQKIESARAAVFLLDEQGKMIGHATRWVIGGTGDKAGLASGATNAFNFVVVGARPFTSTNLTAKVSFSRLVLEGGKLADAARQVTVAPG